MTKLQILKDLKSNLTDLNINFSEIVPNKKLKVKINDRFNVYLTVSCEQDEGGVFLKVHMNNDDDLFYMFETTASTEFESAVKLGKKINTLTKQYARVENFI
jgi:hypothetical protein